EEDASAVVGEPVGEVLAFFGQGTGGAGDAVGALGVRAAAPVWIGGAVEVELGVVGLDSGIGPCIQEVDDGGIEVPRLPVAAGTGGAPWGVERGDGTQVGSLAVAAGVERIEPRLGERGCGHALRSIRGRAPWQVAHGGVVVD